MGTVAGFDWSIISNAAISICSLLLTGFVVPWLVQKYGADKQKYFQGIADELVKAAEQVSPARGSGAKRSELVGEWAQEQGLEGKLTKTQIEAAVYRLHQTKRETTAEEDTGEGSGTTNYGDDPAEPQY